MTQTKKTILLAAVLALVLAGAAISYKYLSSKYTPPTNGIVLPTTETDAAPNTSEKPSAPADTAETHKQHETSTETIPEETIPAETAPPLEPAPDITVTNGSGESVSLSDYIGKPVIINFWATWCGPCKSELPAFDEAYQTYGGDVHFLMVNLADSPKESVANVTAFLTDNGYTFPVLFDTGRQGAMTYGVYSIPLTVFVDAKGNLLGGHPGAMNYATLEEYIRILLTYYAEP